MSDLPNIQENNEQILNDIQSLQQMEQQLFSSLESSPNLSAEQQEKLVEKMNQLSNMRVNLYQTLGGVNNYFQNALNTSVGSLREQAVAIEIVEGELNRAKLRLQALEEEKNNKLRLVEINNYFGDKYAEHSQLMKVVIFTLIPIIIFASLNKSGILPNVVYYALVALVSIIGAYFFWTRFASIIMRDNMNYQEYDWYFDPNAAPTGSTSSTDPWVTTTTTSTGNSAICVGDACCSSGQVWDASLNVCVGDSTVVVSNTTPSTNNGVTTETFINNVLTKQQPGKYKSDYNLGGLNPYNS